HEVVGIIPELERPMAVVIGRVRLGHGCNLLERIFDRSFKPESGRKAAGTIAAERVEVFRIGRGVVGVTNHRPGVRVRPAPWPSPRTTGSVSRVRRRSRPSGARSSRETLPQASAGRGAAGAGPLPTLR